jgi:mannose-6-phosphate isomerase-like protein (cupin superfamily)
MLNTGRLAEEFDAIAEHWSPRVVAMANNQYMKLAKLKGEFVWHAHAEQDELFLVHKGQLVLKFRDGSETVLNPGRFHVVPRGMEHRPCALEETWVILLEPVATRHTGDVETERSKSVETQIAHLK